MKKTRIGLTGLGRIGRVHLQNLVYRLPETQVVAVSDIDPDTRNVAARYGIPDFHTNFEDIIAHPDIEAVIICSPTPTHPDYIKAAAKAGKHIFCEKPLAMTVAMTGEIGETVRACGVKLQVGFNRRFEPDFAKVKSMVEAGHIGDPHILRITSRDFAPPPVEYIKGSGGLFMDMSIHDFDMARFITGSEVTQVYAQGRVRVDDNIGRAGDIDTAIIQLAFENGVIGAIDNSRKAVYGYDQRLEIFGSKGMSLNTHHYPDSQILFDGRGAYTPPVLHDSMGRYVEAYFLEMKAFIQAIREDHKVPVGSFDALMATKIAVAAQRSMEENRPVSLEEFD